MPVKSFWESDDKIPIGQSSVIIKSDNNLDHTAGQKITFHIPAGTEFINPKETYLKMDCLIERDNAQSLGNVQLDEQIGGQVLIRDIRVRTRSGTLLEEIQSYNTLVSVMYDYDTNDNMRKKRAITEGSTVNNPLQANNQGVYLSHKQDTIHNPYFLKETSTNTSSTTEHFKVAKLLLPLHTGIFQNDKVFPVMLTDGLIVEIVLEENRRVFRSLDTVNENRQISRLPFFLNTSGADASGPALTSGDNVTHFYVSPTSNNMNSLEKFPFKPGQQFVFIETDTWAVTDKGVKTQEVGSASLTPTTGTPFVITNIREETGAGTVTKVRVSVSSTSLSGSDVTDSCVMCNRQFIEGTYGFKYKLSNIELVVQQLDMPAGYKSSLMSSMRTGGTMVYDFMSYSNYRFSTLASETQINLRLPLQNSRAKSILCVPTDASTYTFREGMNASGTYFYGKDPNSDIADYSAEFSDRTGLEGIADFIQAYQFLYDNKLQPNRKVDVSKTGNKGAISQQGLIELEKALAMAGIEPRSFRRWNKNFVIGRALSLGDGVFDTRGKDFNLQLEYNGEVPDKNKLWNCYCVHIRGLQISGENINVVL
jgi:hypothetical protein